MDKASIDASFLFPAQNSAETEKSFLSESLKSEKISQLNKCVEKVFKVMKVPKVAFQMVSRRDLARGHPKETLQEASDSVEICDDRYEERRQAFGNKRDDLFYKTIGRDVRKYLQEQFQHFLGEINFKT